MFPTQQPEQFFKTAFFCVHHLLIDTMASPSYAEKVRYSAQRQVELRSELNAPPLREDRLES